MSSNSSSQMFFDTVKMNSNISSVTTGKHTEDIVRSLPTNNKSETFTENTAANGDGQERVLSETGVFFKNCSKSIIGSSYQPATLFDRENVENETKNGFLGFPSESYELKMDVDTSKNAFGNDLYNSHRNDSSVNKEKSNSCVDNVVNDLFQFVRTEKKEYSSDAVNLDKLNLSVSKILNSTKNDTSEVNVKNAETTYDVSSKVPVVEGDHTYHLPLAVFQNSSAMKIEQQCSSDSRDCSEETCRTEVKCSLTNTNGGTSAISKTSSAYENQNKSTDHVSIQSAHHQERKETDNITSVQKAAVVKESDNMCINIAQNDEPSRELNVEITEKEEIQTGIVDDKRGDIIPVQEKASVLKRDNRRVLKNEMRVMSEEKAVENLDFRSEIPQTEKNGFLESQAESCNNNKGAVKEKDVLEVTQSAEFKIPQGLKSVEDKSKNSPNKESTSETQTLNLEHSSVTAETSYDCNECGAKLKTQNSLFIHKKMHLSGAIATSTAIKRKATEENEVPKEVKRKRGRPKLNKTEKTKDSTEEVTPLKENVVKKVLRKETRSDEIKQLKSKKNAKEVKENKISNDTKVAKRERNPRLREAVPMKIISNKPKNTPRSENLNGDCKSTKVESNRSKGKTKNYYSSAVPNNLLRKFTCSDCGAKFKRNDHLKRHRLLHSEKTFQCRDCEMKFYRGDKLKLHIFRHHTKVPPKLTSKTEAVVKVAKLPKKSVECHKCGIQFLRIVPPKTEKPGQSRRKNSCCISCGAKMNDENN